MKKLLVLLIALAAMFTMSLDAEQSLKPIKKTPTPEPTALPTDTPEPTPIPNGLSGHELIQENHSIIAGTATDAVVLCPAGKVILGGGFQSPAELAEEPSLRITMNAPLADGSGWIVKIYHYTLSPRNFHIWAICADEPE